MHPRANSSQQSSLPDYRDQETYHLRNGQHHFFGLVFRGGRAGKAPSHLSVLQLEAESVTLVQRDTLMEMRLRAEPSTTP